MHDVLKAALLTLQKPSRHIKKKQDPRHTSSVLSLYMPFTTKVEQQYVFKLHLKIQPKFPILSLFSCLSGRCKRPILNKYNRCCSVSLPQNMRRRWKLIKLKLLGKREKTFPSMSDFTDTHITTSTSKTGHLCWRQERVCTNLIALGVKSW